MCGSSPRARGTRRATKTRNGVSRFIPACAGNTTTDKPTKRNGAVHPRVRGEHVFKHSASSNVVGSSPRARGTLLPGFSTGFKSRFIPACAGNTPLSLLIFEHLPVHPRVRGEHASEAMAARIRVGSSPRARGTRLCLPVRGRLQRFIPACAGNTRLRGISCITVPVHPRVRGEHRAFSAT